MSIIKRDKKKIGEGWSEKERKLESKKVRKPPFVFSPGGGETAQPNIRKCLWLFLAPTGGKMSAGRKGGLKW